MRLHRRELRRQCSRGERQPVAQRFQGAGGGRFSGDDVEQDARDQRLGFLVPMRLAGFTGRVVDQGVGERHAIVGEIEAVRVDRRERVERSRDEAGDAERIEDMNRAELAALARGDAGVLALGVDADGRERIFEQVGDDRADALAGAGGRDRQQMRGTGIAHRLARLQVAADQQPVIVVEGVRLAGGGEAGRAVRVAGIGIVEPAEQGQDEHPDHDQRHGKVDADKGELGERAVLVELEIPDSQHQQEEQRGEQHHREQDHDDEVAGEPEGGEQHAEQRPHRVGAGGAGKVTCRCLQS